MKKISELTGSNNVIHIKTKKQAKGIAKLFPGYEEVVMEAFVKYYGQNTCLSPIKVGENLKRVYYCDYNNSIKNGYTIHKASDFLPKKSKLAKLSKRLTIVETQIAEMMDKDIDTKAMSNIELKTANINGKLYHLKYEGNAAYIANVDNIEVKDAQQELSTLPEKWCVKPIEETYRYALQFYPNLSNGVLDGLGYLHFPLYKTGSCNLCWSAFIKTGYTEITFEQFKKWVLKEDVSKMESTEPVKLHTWYITEDGVSLFCYLDLDSARVYGFREGNFIEKDSYWGWPLDYKKKTRLATTEEISTALIAEAKKRGFVDGVKFKSAASNELFEATGDYKYYDYDGGFVSYKEGCIFQKGKWAEIVPAEFEWSKPGQLVQYLDSPFLVITGRNNSLVSEYFNGAIVSIDDKYNSVIFGDYRSWNKESFIPYTGEPIILK